MKSTAKIAGAVVLLAAVASGNMVTPRHHKHDHRVEKFHRHLEARHAHLAENQAHSAAEENAATLRLQALLEKTRAHTIHNIDVDAAHYKVLDAKLHLDIGHLDRDITEHDGELAITKKKELIERNNIHDLTARLARLAKHHQRLSHAKVVVASHRKALIESHDREMVGLDKERNNVVATSNKLRKMEVYLQREGKISFAELEQIMTDHASGKNGLLELNAKKFHAQTAADFEGKVKDVTDASSAKGAEIAGMLNEFIGMLDKELAQADAAIKRSNEHFDKGIQLLNLKDGHLDNEMRDVELDEKTTASRLARDKVQLQDLKHKEKMVVGELKSEHEQRKAMESEEKQEAVAEDRKQHNFSHERDVEDTLIGMLGGKDEEVKHEFKGAAAIRSAEAAASQKHEHTLALQEQRRRHAEAEKRRLAKLFARKQARAAKAHARMLARAEAARRKHAAAEAREHAHEAAEAKQRDEVEKQRAAVTKAREEAEKARAAHTASVEAARVAAAQARHQRKLQQEANDRVEEAQKKKDVEAATKAAHEAAAARAAAQEMDRKAAQDRLAAKKHAADEARQNKLLAQHRQAVAVAQAAQAKAAKAVADAQAAAFKAVQQQLANEARAKEQTLAKRIKDQEKKAKADAAAEKTARDQAAHDKKVAREAAIKARKAQRAAAKAARKAEMTRRHEEKKAFHDAVHHVFHPTEAPLTANFPKRIGCFNDRGDRDLPTELSMNDGNMSPERCTALAAAKGFKYFGTQYSRECFGSNSAVMKYGPSNNCNMPCSGDRSQTCGGTWALEIYEMQQVKVTEVKNVVLSNLWTFKNSVQWNFGTHYKTDAEGVKKALEFPGVKAVNVLPGTRIDIFTSAKDTWGQPIKMEKANGWNAFLVDPSIDAKKIHPEGTWVQEHEQMLTNDEEQNDQEEQ